MHRRRIGRPTRWMSTAGCELRRLTFARCANDPGSRDASPDCVNAREAERLEGVGSLRKLAPLALPSPSHTESSAQDSDKGIRAMGFFATFSTWLNGLLSTYIATNTARVAALLAARDRHVRDAVRDDLGLFAAHGKDRGALRDRDQAHCHARGRLRCALESLALQRFDCRYFF